jgi:hypothetical protein
MSSRHYCTVHPRSLDRTVQTIPTSEPERLWIDPLLVQPFRHQVERLEGVVYSIK